MKEYGVNAHRMSLSWSRIIPGGGRDQPVNQKGVEFYRRVIQGLLDAGIVSRLKAVSCTADLLDTLRCESFCQLGRSRLTSRRYSIGIYLRLCKTSTTVSYQRRLSRISSDTPESVMNRSVISSSFGSRSMVSMILGKPDWLTIQNQTFSPYLDTALASMLQVDLRIVGFRQRETVILSHTLSGIISCYRMPRLLRSSGSCTARRISKLGLWST